MFVIVDLSQVFNFPAVENDLSGVQEVAGFSKSNSIVGKFSQNFSKRKSSQLRKSFSNVKYKNKTKYFDQKFKPIINIMHKNLEKSSIQSNHLKTPKSQNEYELKISNLPNLKSLTKSNFNSTCFYLQ